MRRRVDCLGPSLSLLCDEATEFFYADETLRGSEGAKETGVRPVGDLTSFSYKHSLGENSQLPFIAASAHTKASA